MTGLVIVGTIAAGLGLIVVGSFAWAAGAQLFDFVRSLTSRGEAS